MWKGDHSRSFRLVADNDATDARGGLCIGSVALRTEGAMNADNSREMHYFWLLSKQEQAAAICRLAAQGMPESGIATATMLSVEQVRIVLGQRRALEELH